MSEQRSDNTADPVAGLTDASVLDAPPDTRRETVRVRLTGGDTVDLHPSVVRHIEPPAWRFLERPPRPAPARHVFGLVVGHPSDLQIGTEAAADGTPEAAAAREWRLARLDTDDANATETRNEAGNSTGDVVDGVVIAATIGEPALEEAARVAGERARERYALTAQRALTRLQQEHAPDVLSHSTPMSYRIGLDGEDRSGSYRGTLVASVVFDEFRASHVGSRSPNGEAWFWYLDGQEVPQYTAMEALIRDVVDHARGLGERPMSRGSLWWVRALHVHPRCRGEQLGGRLLAHALWELVRGPRDLVVLEAHPEPTRFAAEPAMPGLADWETYQQPSCTGVDGLARYFGRMGFLRADDPQHGAAALRLVTHGYGEPDDVEEVSRRLAEENGAPDDPERAVAMYAFAGDLRFTGWPRLGARMR
jgi:GNAT superfamily N-acetyltransferase